MKYLLFVTLVAFLFLPTKRTLALSFFPSDSLLSPLSTDQAIGQNLPPDRSQTQSFSERVMNIPLFVQEKNLSCEAASVKMILAYFGQDTSEDEIQNSFTKDPNPTLGFRGNVNGPVWGFTDYGVYPQAVVTTFKKYGHQATALTNISEQEVKQAVLTGHPVIIWVDIANPNPEQKQVKVGAEVVKLVSGEHTVVVTGFKDGQWYLNDPWRRTYKGKYRLPEKEMVKSLDETNWNLLDHMAVVVN